MTCADLSLDATPFGGPCRVLRLTAGGAVRQRLLDMGLLPGSVVRVERAAPLGDPLELRLGEAGESFVAIRRHQACQVLVSVSMPTGESET